MAKAKTVDPADVRLVGQYTTDYRKIRRARADGLTYVYKVPKLTVSGRRLERAGFDAGCLVIVTCPRPGALVIQRVQPQAEPGAAPTPRPSRS